MAALSLAGKIALVTGGSRGIGLAIAQRFAREGASCVLVGRDEKTLKGAVQTLGPPSGKKEHGYLEGDVAKKTTWDNIVKQHSQIDILVNAAGIPQNQLLLRLSTDEIFDILRANLQSAMFGCRYVGISMIRNRIINSGGGCIINVSSLMAKKGGKGAAIYAATKAGLLGLTSSLSVEYGHLGIRVNALAPGYIDTRMTEDLDKGLLARRIPLGRLGTADEVADAAAFLAKNQYANNCILTIDGGVSAV